ncbi:MAG: deoxyhypusine synthase [Gemmatimonadaceae bacterium]|nr:deoxyhypusine synthase [Gemmatimonadaceae bacterium]NUQ93483.1 deoxyhypusine synthase [Gemmatimonadaceae bacterium]NUR19831.1 deoxyhypusine synthase [Gemmatimonadaceae bacterium]NUS96475.1 deoxyhypusine synthase [Gemmatimonadaceae bacterium]
MAKKKSGEDKGGADRERSGFKASRHGDGKRASAAGNKSEQKRLAEERERALRGQEAKERGEAVHTTHEKSRFLRGQRIDPRRIDGKETVAELIEGTFLAYNAARLREAAQLFTNKMLQPDVTIGLTLTGALTPAGLGMAALIPLIEAGFVDWIISTGANLYHDTHFGLGLAMHRGNAQESDTVLREEGVVRIYDIFFDYDVLLSTDAFFRQIIRAPEFQRTMSSAEFHNLCGKYVAEREKALGIGTKSLLSAAYAAGVPIYTSSPGDSSIGMNIAALALEGGRCLIDPNRDVNETASIVLGAKRGGGKSGVMILGGGSPKNFMLQTEPQIQEVLGIDERGHDYFLQVTDARPDTGGLSGATPAEAVSWGKIDPDRLPDAVVCYLDSTVALPLLTSYALARTPKRPLKRLYDQRERNMKVLLDEFARASEEPLEAEATDTKLPMHR